MIYRREPDGLVIARFDREDGPDLRTCAENLAVRLNIKGAEISSAIGALKGPRLGYYDLAKKAYDPQIVFPGDWELVSTQGNIALREGKPFVHLHVGIGGRDFVQYGGHLMDAQIAVFVEMWIRPTVLPLVRLPCEEIGLHQWEPQIMIEPG